MDMNLPADEQRLLARMLGAREAGQVCFRVPWRERRVAKRLAARDLAMVSTFGRRAELTADGWWAAIGRRARRPHRV